MKNDALLTPRQIAGRLNRQKRRGISPEGRERLRAVALKYQPWRRSTGPRTAAGRAQAAANGKRRQRGKFSVRERRRLVADAVGMAKSMKELRFAALENRQGGDNCAFRDSNLASNFPSNHA